MFADGFVDALAARHLVRDIGKQGLEGWPGCVSFSPKDVRIKRRVGEERLHPLSEVVAPKQAARTKVSPGIDPSAFAHENKGLTPAIP
jgi:hypothetical protein